MNWQEFFYMGGYGSYIWISYGVFAVVLAISFVMPLIKRRSFEHQLKQRLALEARRKANHDSNP